MSKIVIYKSRYGSTKAYAKWIAEELGCEAVEAKTVKAEDLERYDTIVYGGGLYAEMVHNNKLLNNAKGFYRSFCAACQGHERHTTNRQSCKHMLHGRWYFL